ncbi:MAG TPA: DnaB-like helicase N-terminal domain-containing protein, partial [Levilinea sp.]|nr:DnaB-like helicase N-terminal domain-containing protein [Levilinea sp.]
MDIETNLWSTYWTAKDAGNTMIAARTTLGLLDYYERDGCISPDAALLAALLIDPAGIAVVREIVTPEMFTIPADSRLYTAMLCTPVTAGLDTWWPLLARIAGLPLVALQAYMQYDYYSVAYIADYARAVRAAYVKEQAFLIARQMLTTLNTGDA